MTDYKVSVIMPVYNGEKYIRNSLDSITAQSMGIENIEVIIVNDASTDNTEKIINEYCEKYESFKAVHLNENIGAAYGPRNIALKKASSPYIMFLDSDDTFEVNACETLYSEITSDKNTSMVFGRYMRVYPEFKLKSYSPYEDNFSGPDDIEFNPNFSSIKQKIWKIAKRVIYGKKLSEKNKIQIENINENPEILSILPSIWTRMVRKSFLEEHNIEFPELITGEDLNFNLDVYSKGKIIFLNDKFITNYYMRFEDEELSITKNITFKLVYDSIKAYRIAVEKSNSYNFKKISRMINPFLLNFINLLTQADLTESEKEILKNEVNMISRIYKNKGIITGLLLRIILIFL